MQTMSQVRKYAGRSSRLEVEGPVKDSKACSSPRAMPGLASPGDGAAPASLATGSAGPGTKLSPLLMFSPSLFPVFPISIPFTISASCASETRVLFMAFKQVADAPGSLQSLDSQYYCYGWGKNAGASGRKGRNVSSSILKTHLLEFPNVSESRPVVLYRPTTEKS